MKRSWVEISLDNILNNYEIYKSCISNSVEVMVVVKADAYGHGDVTVAHALESKGICNFAVSNIKEAIRLRQYGIKGQILILGYTPLDQINELIEYNITQTIFSEEYLNAIQLPIKCQIAVDTGMNRIGFKANDLKYCENMIRKAALKFELTGVFTHLCVADDKNEINFTNSQIKKFKDVVNSVKDLKLKYIHCMNSAGGLWHKPYGNMVRLGIVLYGLKPDYTNELPVGIKPALVWKSIIAMIKDVFVGETIGYGRTYTVTRNMKIATIPTGYADGYNRALSNQGCVYINGCKAQVVGRVCMDQLMVDITDIECNIEDEVILMGNDFTADDMATMIGTIGYEVVCDIGKRVDRYYI